MATPTLTPTQIGNISEAKLHLRFTEQGYNVLVPIQNGLRYDFAIEKDGVFQRVQAKTGQLIDEEYILFRTSSKDPLTNQDIDYVGDIDLFAVYCPQNDTCYLLPIGGLPASACTLRVAPTKNGQRKGIRWAEDYEF